MNFDDDKKRRDRDRLPNDWMFIAMERMIEKMFREMARGNIKPGKSYVRGFNINMNPDGTPRIEEFGNYPQKNSNGDYDLSEERVPLADVFEIDDSVAITIEIPGIEKKDIDLNVKDSTLEIDVDHPTRKYHKLIDLPCNVHPEKTKATYNNGILDVVLEKTNNDESDGYDVSII